MFDFGVEEVKSRNNLRDVIESYGLKLNRKGFVVCPFHQDKNGSMKVYADGHFYCFGCGEHGDVIKFVQLYEQCDFPTVYHKLGGVDRALTKEEKKRFREEMLLREREAKRKAAVKENIRQFENVIATLHREILALGERTTDWTEEFTEELQKLEKWRLKCEIELCVLREKI